MSKRLWKKVKSQRQPLKGQLKLKTCGIAKALPCYETERCPETKRASDGQFLPSDFP
jgi:hypothetical protein